MNEAEEKIYLRGERAVWLDLMRRAIKELGPHSADANEHRWRLEREEAIAMLRRVCEHQGDNDWEDDLHLADIIDKHLWRHLGNST